jgi:hypothetical protein
MVEMRASNRLFVPLRATARLETGQDICNTQLPRGRGARLEEVKCCSVDLGVQGKGCLPQASQ